MRVTARIMGEDYTIRGRSPQEHIERIARYVDEKMIQISEAYPKLGTSRVAVLAAINMADELFKIREQYEQLTQLLEEEWSQRHGAPGASEAPAPRAAPRVPRLPSAATEAAAAADGPGQVQLKAFGEPPAGGPPAVSARPGAAGPLLTGDAFASPKAAPDRPGKGEGLENPEDEDQ